LSTDNSVSGTRWGIWDLHVHTPASIVQQYGARDNDAIWERFISDLEGLPSHYRVIGINDYWLLDGYKRVLEFKRQGRLRNLDAIFPVIEVRVDQFAGTEGDLSRLNFHAIFDPELSTDLIEQQFLAGLKGAYVLDPGTQAPTWQNVVTYDSLVELGRQVRENSPNSDSWTESDLEIGFNNLNIEANRFFELLENTSLKGHVAIGLGKAEWADLKWSDQSIAQKKNQINRAHLLFSAMEDTSKWAQHVAKLREQNVPTRLFDCSDAHDFSTSDHYMRIGACQTWLNAAPDFKGLMHALREFERRVYVGLEPPALRRVNRDPRKFIQQIEVDPNVSGGASAFDYCLPLNPGFVAIVGNKGQGKSALLDSIALAGNSSRTADFAFLSQRRFLSPANSDRNRYSATLTWQSGDEQRVSFGTGHDRGRPVDVEYLPQSWVERVCNATPHSEDDVFEEELREVLFTHVPESERAGESTFKGLQEQLSRASSDRIEALRGELKRLVAKYVDACAFRADNTELEVASRLKLREADKTRAEATLAEAEAAHNAMIKGSSDEDELRRLTGELDGVKHSVANTTAQIREVSENLAAIGRGRATLNSIEVRAAELKVEADGINREMRDICSTASSPPEDYVNAVINVAVAERWRASAALEEERLRTSAQELAVVLSGAETRQTEIEEELAKVDAGREIARQRMDEVRARLAGIVGTTDDVSSVLGLTHLLVEVRKSGQAVDDAQQRVLEQARSIHAELQDQLSVLGSMFAPAEAFISDSVAIGKAGLKFEASLEASTTWSSVAEALDGRRNTQLTPWLEGLTARASVNDWDSLGPELAEFLVRLPRERGDIKGSPRNLDEALRQSTNAVVFIGDVLGISWLEVRFVLTENGTPLHQLSPGQRGLVLALFYLVVDRRSTPLLLDQPEENLDNDTIAHMLVPAIHEASSRRQTIVVTHNANLAVVGDADQIVHCRHEDGEFSVTSGPLSALKTVTSALNILEGTKPAFDNRRNKYDAFS